MKRSLRAEKDKQWGRMRPADRQFDVPALEHRFLTVCPEKESCVKEDTKDKIMLPIFVSWSVRHIKYSYICLTRTLSVPMGKKVENHCSRRKVQTEESQFSIFLLRSNSPTFYERICANTLAPKKIET
jgi:hypothetical protein